MSKSLKRKMRKVVSGSRNRFQESGYDLDLSYVEESLIAMGLPSEGIESLYRNEMSEVKKFLKEKHGEKYFVLNLSEKEYDSKHFGDRYVDIKGWVDHQSPPLRILFTCSKVIQDYYKANPGHVACVHCKAGKGRTGTICVAYLMLKEKFPTTTEGLNEGLKFFVSKRSSKNNFKDGVTIPSQKVYLRYFVKRIQEAKKGKFSIFKPLTKPEMKMKELKITNYSKKMEKKFRKNELLLNCYYSYVDPLNPYQIKREVIFKLKPNTKKNFRKGQAIVIDLGNKRVKGDIVIEGMDMKKPKKCLFRVFFHTYFHTKEQKIIFNKYEIDKAGKKKDSVVSKDFKIEVSVENCIPILKGGKFVRALYNYEANYEDEVSFQKDDIIEIWDPKLSVYELPKGWIFGKPIEAEEPGMFPDNYVTPINIKGEDNQYYETDKFVALYDYDSTKEDELKFKKGDIIIKTGKDFGDWMIGKLKKNGKIGLFPSTHVEKKGTEKIYVGKNSKETIEEVILKEKEDYDKSKKLYDERKKNKELYRQRIRELKKKKM